MSALKIAKLETEDDQRARGDAELVTCARRGDTDAFAELVKRYQALACAVAYSATGDMSASEDIAQEAFVTAWMQLGRLDEPSKFRSWLAGIARNTARYWRRHQRRHAPRADLGLAVVEELATDEPSPHDQVAARQHLSATRTALTKLPDNYREAIVLYYALGESYTEVANSLQISEATARQRLSRARKKLSGEVSEVASAARACGKRAGAAAAVLLLIKSRAAMAAATATKAKLASGLSSKGIVALAATGIGAALVCVVSLGVLLLGQDAPSDRDSSRRGHSANETHSTPLAAPVPAAPVAQHSADEAEEARASATVTPDDSIDLRGEVAIGRGRVRDKSSQSLPSLYGASRSQSTTRSDESAMGRPRVKHGPAIVEPQSRKTLIKPTLDLRAVEREMHGD